jgi:hypothetical protein
MAWNEKQSRERIESRWKARDTEITVAKLGRDMNLVNVTLKNGKRIQGVHLYCTVAGPPLHALADAGEARDVLQALDLWQGEVLEMADKFDVPVIAFQGGRVHLLVFRPIDDDAATARKALMLAKAIIAMTLDAFNPLFKQARQLSPRAAVDLGQTVATRGGVRNDSELLFLGTAANRPAKLLSGTRMLATDRLIDKVDDDKLTYTTEETAEEDAKVVRIKLVDLDAAMAADGIDWSVDKSSKRLKEQKEKWPAHRYSVGGATERIDPDDLGRSNSKLVPGLVVIADIDGFSDYIAQAEADDTKRGSIMTLDAIRQELREVLKVDFKGVRVQYQGDNMIGFVHLPHDAEAKRAAAAVEIAAAMQSSIKTTLPTVVPGMAQLKVSIGVASSDIVVTRLGKHAARTALIVGPAASGAEAIQMRLEGGQIGLNAAAYEQLSGAQQALFGWDGSAKAWVASDLEAAKLARVTESLSSQNTRVLTPTGDGRYGIGVGAAGAVSTKVPRVKPFAPR